MCLPRVQTSAFHMKLGRGVAQNDLVALASFSGLQNLALHLGGLRRSLVSLSPIIRLHEAVMRSQSSLRYLSRHSKRRCDSVKMERERSTAPVLNPLRVSRDQPPDVQAFFFRADACLLAWANC